jgi:hypothetical protein
MNKTRFDLEQDILKARALKEDLEILYHKYGEDLDNAGQNLILGLIELHDARMSVMLETLEELIRNGKVI